MKQVKIILLMLYVGGYTSLIWANAMFDWIKVGEEGVAMGAILFIFFTIVNLLAIVGYLTENWYK